MKVIDAFAGLGGFSLAADALGWDTVAFVEWDKDCQFWLSEHWPSVPIYGDITTVQWEDAARCDIFTAGFPCQPHSVAGKRAASDDSRDLWSECVRAISTLRPRYAVLENVSGLLTSESGRFFNRVLSDLAKIGYVGRYDVLSAAECGAPHRRERVWIVAHAAAAGLLLGDGARTGTARPRIAEPECRGGWLDNADRGRREQRHASIRCDDVVEPRHDSVGDPDDTRSQGHGRPVELDGEAGRYAQGRHGTPPSVRLRLPNWADAIPYRGADGTVRLIPAGAVANAKRLSGQEAAASRSDGAQRTPASGRSGSDGRSKEEVSRSEPALRALADGIPDNVARRHAAEEGRQGEVTLWPVTDSEPGRVARLKAVGNAVVPAWVLAGPFQYILDREGLRDNEPSV